MINLKRLFKNIVLNILKSLNVITAPSKAKLGISYSVWDGEELLEASIKSVRENADYINVVWQRKSWHGADCNDDLENLLFNLKEKGLIDEIILFEPDFSLAPQQNEVNKRNVGLKAAVNSGCSHFLLMDCDEFYDKDEFKAAKEFIYKNYITHSACIIEDYFAIDYRSTVVGKYYVPFIYKVDKLSKLDVKANTHLCWKIDPTRKIALKLFHRCWFADNLIMHHYTGVHKNKKRKLENSSALLDKESVNSFLNAYDKENYKEMINDGRLIYVDNKFNIPSID